MIVYEILLSFDWIDWMLVGGCVCASVLLVCVYILKGNQ